MARFSESLECFLLESLMMAAVEVSKFILKTMVCGVLSTMYSDLGNFQSKPVEIFY